MPDPQLPWYQDPRWIATTAFALWGAGLSTYQLFERRREAAEKRREKMPAIRLDFYPSSGGLYEANKEIESYDHLIVKVSNTGLMDVWLKPGCCSIEADNVFDEHFGLQDGDADVKFPHVLKPGDSLTFTVDENQFFTFMTEDGENIPLPRMRAVITDAVGRTYESGWREFNWKGDPTAE